ncbi:hypothetical protein WMZ97_20495 [Lentibacillus sp. N15]|uniref:anti-sigma-I factor RsgI family protein n=1 Tax=Lentibacillus songyuanensis TaxID=3136161 RepID=UPI0031BB45A3
MNKGIVVEKHRQHTIVMTQSGMFLKAKPVGDTAGIGSEIPFERLEGAKRYFFFFYPGQPLRNSARLLAMGCFMLLFALPLYVLTGHNKTYAYINVDLNPSIELEIDDRLHVRSMKPLNDQASIVLETLSNYKRKPLDQMISRLIAKSEQSGLTTQGKNVIVGVNYVKSRHISVLDTLKSYLNDQHHDWQVTTFLVPKKVRQTAKEQDKAMNEVMAKKMEEDSESVRNEKGKLNKNEKAIIHSFYHTT